MKKSYFTIVVTMLLCMVCSSWTTAKQHHTLSGMIHLEGKGIQGVSVFIGAYCVPTGKQGRFYAYYLPKGEYTVQPKKQGYTFTPAIQRIKVEEGNIPSLQPFTAHKNNGNGPAPGTVAIETVSIPAGSFLMGSTPDEVGHYKDEAPQHIVTLRAFSMSIYEITFEQYDTFCEATGREKPYDDGLGRGKCPVVNVSWFDAVAFAEWVGGRLPTEAEWEYACRAGTTTPFYTGQKLFAFHDNIRPAADELPISSLKTTSGSLLFQQEDEEEIGKTAVVGESAQNPWGLYNMHGNVSEWCSDWYGSYTDATVENPTGPAEGKTKVWRGGSYMDVSNFARSANRRSMEPEISLMQLGFRVVFSD